MNIIEFFKRTNLELNARLADLKKSTDPEDMGPSIQSFISRYEYYENMKSQKLLSRLEGLVDHNSDNREAIRYNSIYDGKDQLIRQLRGISFSEDLASMQLALANFIPFVETHFAYENDVLFPTIGQMLDSQTLLKLGSGIENLPFVEPPQPAAPKPSALHAAQRGLRDLSWKFSLIGLLACGAILLGAFFLQPWNQPRTNAMTYVYAAIATGLLFPLLDYLFRKSHHSQRRHVKFLEGRADDFERQSITDALTGLYTFGYMSTQLDLELSRAKRSGASLSCLFIDIDHFKEINDAHGHTAGNIVLADAARAILEATRKSDVVGRYGGDEFLILLPHTGMRAASAVGERVRSSVEKISFPNFRGLDGITVSIGLAVSSAVKACDKTDLLNAADEALRKAKRDGRNRLSLQVVK